MSTEILVSPNYAMESGHDKLEVLREQWESCNGEWSKSQIYLSLKKTQAERKRGQRRWMTRRDLIVKHDSVEVADRIIANKMNNEETRAAQTKAHPDDPDNEDFTLRESFIYIYNIHIIKYNIIIIIYIYIYSMII